MKDFLFLQSFLLHSKEKITNSISTWDFTSWLGCYALKWNKKVEKNRPQSVSLLPALGLVRTVSFCKDPKDTVQGLMTISASISVEESLGLS